MTTTNLTTATFEQAVKDNHIVFVDFWATWCGPCRMFSPIFEEASDRHPELYFGKVDTEAEASIAVAAGIRSIPTLMAFKEGIRVFQQAGAFPASMLEDFIQEVRDLDMEHVRSHIAHSASTADSSSES